ncbi:MAG: sodium:solute symporter, partial [Marinoscillum sp.]
TYGPLLGLFAFGIFTKWDVKDGFVPLVSVLSPLLSYIINLNSEALLGGYKFGFEILILNGLIMFLGLLIIRRN